MSIQQQQITKHTNKQLHNISVFTIVTFVTIKTFKFSKILFSEKICDYFFIKGPRLIFAFRFNYAHFDCNLQEAILEQLWYTQGTAFQQRGKKWKHCIPKYHIIVTKQPRIPIFLLKKISFEQADVTFIDRDGQHHVVWICMWSGFAIWDLRKAST